MTAVGLKALMSHWWRNPFQLVTLMVGLALATGLWSGVQAINAEARASYAQAADVLTPGEVGRITAKDGAAISTADYVALRRAGWPVTPVLEGRLGDLRVVGIEPLTANRPTGDADGAGIGAFGRFLDGTVFAHPDDAPGLADRGLNVEVNDTQQQGVVIADIAVAQGLLQQPGAISVLVMLADPPTAVLGDVAAALQLAMAEDQNDIARLTDSFHLNLTAFGLLSFVVGIFIVYSAIGLAFEQRRPVFRILRALGLPLGRLVGLLCLELMSFTLVAGSIGCLLGYVIAAALLPDVAATLKGLYGADVSGQLQFRPSWFLSGLAISVFGTVVASIGAFWRLRQLPLVASSQPRAWVSRTARNSAIMAGIALGLGCVSVLVIVFGSGLVAGFVSLGCLLVGSAFALPFCLDRALRMFGASARSALGRWFWSDTRQQLPGLSMALMALLLAMAANIGVSTMVSSFRTTFVSFLDQRLSAELYVRAQSPAQAMQIIALIEGDVDAVLPIIFADDTLDGMPVAVYGIENHATYRQNWQMLDGTADVWDRVADGTGVLVNEQLFRRAGLQVDDKLDLLPDAQIVGVFGDYGNPGGQVMMGMAQFRALYPDVAATRFGIRTKDPDAIAAKIRAAHDLSADGVVNQRDLKDFSLSVFERTFSVTAALNVLTLAVAGLAIMISLLTLSAMRLPQLAPVWAMGLTRRDLARMELVRALCLAAMTAVLAFPVGLALAWVLLAVVNVEAFGWRLPMYLFPSKYAVLAVCAVLAAALAALWPAFRLSRMPPGQLLRVFSNER